MFNSFIQILWTLNSLGTISKCLKAHHSSAQNSKSLNSTRPHKYQTTNGRTHLTFFKNIFGKKRTSQSHNSKAPCEDAGGYSSKIIYIPSKTFMDIILKTTQQGRSYFSYTTKQIQSTVCNSKWRHNNLFT